MSSGTRKIPLQRGSSISNSEQRIPFGAGGLQASLGAPASGTDLNFPYQLPVHDRLFMHFRDARVLNPRLVNDFRFGFVHINNSGDQRESGHGRRRGN